MRHWVGLLFISSLAFASETSPWVSPLGEFHSILDYQYTWQNFFQSPAGSFNSPGAVNQLEWTLQVSPWPDYETQISLDFAEAPELSFNFAAARAWIRYQWLDDICGDPISLVTALYIETPRGTYIRNNNFFYIGYLDVEGSVTIGRSFYPKGAEQWVQCLWVYAGLGTANQGSGWFRGFANYSFRLTENLVWSWQSRMQIGFGSKQLIEDAPFHSYGPIAYRYVDFLTQLSADIGRIGSLSGWVFYNVYAHNTSEYYYGGGVSLDIPFSL